MIFKWIGIAALAAVALYGFLRAITWAMHHWWMK
jgi:hypothetical protein